MLLRQSISPKQITEHIIWDWSTLVLNKSPRDPNPAFSHT